MNEQREAARLGQLGMECARMEEEQSGSCPNADNQPARLADLPDVLTAEQVAGVMQMSMRALYQALRSGELPAFKVGRRYFIPKRRFEQFLDGE